MSEIIFLVEEAPEGGVTARALGESIFTEADNLSELHTKVDHSRVASASYPAEVLARTGLGHFDHPAPPLWWLTGYRPQI